MTSESQAKHSYLCSFPLHSWPSSWAGKVPCLLCLSQYFLGSYFQLPLDAWWPVTYYVGFSRWRRASVGLLKLNTDAWGCTHQFWGHSVFRTGCGLRFMPTIWTLMGHTCYSYPWAFWNPQKVRWGPMVLATEMDWCHLVSGALPDRQGLGLDIQFLVLLLWSLSSHGKSDTGGLLLALYWPHSWKVKHG